MRLLRIVCISDTHGQHTKLSVPDGDVLIHAGDFTAFGERPKEIIDFNQWAGKQPHQHKIVIAGNHDSMFERHPGAARELLGNAIYLENSATELAGLKIWGSPVQPEFNNWAFNIARGAAIRRYWKMIPTNTDVLVTHGPPFGVLDKAHPSSAHLGARNWQRLSNRLSLGFMCLATSMEATDCPAARIRNLSTRRLSMRRTGSFMSRKLSRSRFHRSR
jgi:Icc-related predicted phosphoesterase